MAGTGNCSRDCLGAFLSGRHCLLDHRIPFAACRAFSHPFRAFVSTLLAEPHCLCLRCRHILLFLYPAHAEAFNCRCKLTKKRDTATPGSISYYSCSERIISGQHTSARTAAHTASRISSRSSPLYLHTSARNLPSLCTQLPCRMLHT